MTLTADGQAMVALARGILEANERARQYFAVSELRGRLRFGAAEDFVRSRLPEVLREFTRIHRAVDLELRVDLSGTLFQALEAQELDLVLAKRRPGEDRGRLVRRERLIWIAADSALADPERPLPLILYPPPSISRAIALEALERAGRSWRIVCTSGQPERPQRRGLGRDWDMRPVRRLCAGRAFGTAAIVGIAGARPDRICRRRERARLARPGERVGGGHSRQCRSAVRRRPPAEEKPSDDPVLARFRAAVIEIYGERLERVVLFGSRARGDAKPDSDYDIAVFLNDAVRSHTIVRALPPSAPIFSSTRRGHFRHAVSCRPIANAPASCTSYANGSYL